MPDLGQLLSEAVQAVLDGIGGLFDNMAASLVDVLSGVIGQFPTADPLGLSPASGILIGYAWLNSWLPVAELIGALSMIVLVATVIFGVRIAIKLWEWLPFKFS